MRCCRFSVLRCDSRDSVFRGWARRVRRKNVHRATAPQTASQRRKAPTGSKGTAETLLFHSDAELIADTDHLAIRDHDIQHLFALNLAAHFVGKSGDYLFCG